MQIQTRSLPYPLNIEVIPTLLPDRWKISMKKSKRLKICCTMLQIKSGLES